MSTEEALLLVMTVALVLLISMIIAVLVVVFQTMKKLKRTLDQVQELTHKGTSVAEAMAPFSAAIVGMMQVMKVFRRKRK